MVVRKNKSNENEEIVRHLKQYNIYAGTLRNWFVGYGIGFLFLFITRLDLDLFSILDNSQRITIISYVLIGIFFQIVVSLYNKYSQWLSYQKVYREIVGSWIHDAAERLTKMWWLDFLFDFLTLIAFGFPILYICLIYLGFV